jgi:hypothetical protein
MPIRKLPAGEQAYDAATYVGTAGRLFYDEDTGVLRRSDGVTPGGLPIPFTIASDTVVGGIKAGPGVTINSEGQILIDSEGLEFSFGDFQGTVGTYTDSTAYALLSSVNTDEDVVIASNGTGSIKVVGQFDIYQTNGTVTGSLEDEEPFFRVKDDGQIRMLVPPAGAAEGALEIVGNDSGIAHPPNQSGVILHITGNSPVDGVGQQCRNYFDSRDSYVVLTGRRFNGPASSVTKVLNGETIMRVVGQAATDTGFQTFGPARVDFVATQDQAVGAQGGEVQIYSTANNTAATSAVKVAAFNATTGVTSAVGFVGNLTGNASTVTNGVYTTDTATVTNTMLAGSIANAKLANSTISGIALGSTLAALSPGNYLTGTDYDGSTVRTFAVDATTAATASKVVARDSNATVAGANFQGTVRNVGTVTAGAGTEITINFATDHIIRCNYSTETIEVGFSNYTAGRTVTLIATNTSGGNRVLDIGIAAANTQGDATLDVNNDTTAIITYYCTGTTINDVFASTVYDI